MLDHQFFWGQKQKGRSRFNLLLLEYGEYFFEDLSAWCSHISTVTSTASQKDDAKEALDNKDLQVQGRLKICSRSLIFEPTDVKKPVKKYPFKGIISSIEEIVTNDKTSVISFGAESFFEMKANNVVGPYRFFETQKGGVYDDNGMSAKSSSSTPSAQSGHALSPGCPTTPAALDDDIAEYEKPIRVVISLIHSENKDTVMKLEQLRRIFVESEQSSCATEQMLSPFVDTATTKLFDSSQLVDFHETLEYKVYLHKNTAN